MRVLAGLTAALSLFTLANVARAGEDELILALEPGYYALTAAGDRPDPGTTHGVGLGASLWLGTDTPFWLSAAVGGSAQLGPDEMSAPIEVLVGIVYALDVFTVIPYLEAHAGLMIPAAGDGDLHASARFGLGFDYLVSRTMSVGAVARIRPVAAPLGDALISGHIRWAVRLEY